MDQEHELSEIIQPVTTRLFGDDLMDFKDLINVWRRKTKDLGIGESEATNAAILRVLKLAMPDRREKEIERLQLTGDQIQNFHEFCDESMDDFLNDLKEIMERRDKLDKRKRRKVQS